MIKDLDIGAHDYGLEFIIMETPLKMEDPNVFVHINLDNWAMTM